MEEGTSLQIRAVELEIKGVGALRNIILKTACRGIPVVPTCAAVPPAPNFTLPNVPAGDVRLSDYTGQPALLLFHMKPWSG